MAHSYEHEAPKMDNGFRAVVFCPSPNILRTITQALATTAAVYSHASTTDPNEVVALSLTHHLVIMEALPDLTTAIGLIRGILLKTSNTKILMISDSYDTNYISAVLREGISGYLLLSSCQEKFSDVLLALFTGKVVLSPEITAALLKRA
jgi:DNA-binding NarL/FixJ family response regulator